MQKSDQWGPPWLGTRIGRTLLPSQAAFGIAIGARFLGIQRLEDAGEGARIGSMAAISRWSDAASLVRNSLLRGPVRFHMKFRQSKGWCFRGAPEARQAPPDDGGGCPFVHGWRTGGVARGLEWHDWQRWRWRWCSESIRLIRGKQKPGQWTAPQVCCA